MTNETRTLAEQYHPGRLLGAAVLTNVAMGAIYAWGAFLLPLEKYLEVSRTELSVVPTVALISFTAGMVLHDWLRRTLGGSYLFALVFALTGGGHLFFAWLPGYWSLLLGYGGFFGLGSGLGYGIALSLASDTGAHRRPLAIGVAMAAFASSGIVMPLVAANVISARGLPFVFGGLGLLILAIGGGCAALLGEQGLNRAGWKKIAASTVAPLALSDWNFVRLCIIFFCICFVGLMTTSQLAGIVSSHGLDALVGYSLSIFTFGYLLGSLFGGQAVRVLGGWRALAFASALTALGLTFLDLGGVVLTVLGAAFIGATFGSSASLMPTLVAELYGAERIGEIYGRLMISYGLAGLLAPWGSGALYDAFGGYAPAIVAGLAMCALSGALAFSFRPPR